VPEYCNLPTVRQAELFGNANLGKRGRSLKGIKKLSVFGRKLLKKYVKI
jgi:hypothetical protein